MFRMWDVGDVRCWGCEMLGMWDVRDVGCSGCGMCRMWGARDVGCRGCGMFGMWHVGCGMFAGMWDVDLQNACRMLQTNSSLSKLKKKQIYQLGTDNDKVI